MRIAVSVPFEFHRYIIGVRGQDVRSMADKYSVSIEVPQPDAQEDKIYVNGPAQNCDSAKLALEMRVQELEAEKEERVSGNMQTCTCMWKVNLCMILYYCLNASF